MESLYIIYVLYRGMTEPEPVEVWDDCTDEQNGNELRERYFKKYREDKNIDQVELVKLNLSKDSIKKIVDQFKVVEVQAEIA